LWEIVSHEFLLGWQGVRRPGVKKGKEKNRKKGGWKGERGKNAARVD